MLKNIFKSIMTIAFYLVVLLALYTFFAIIVGQGIDKEINHQCLVLQSQSRDYKEAGFWLTPSEKSMCDAIGIIIDSPVKTK